MIELKGFDDVSRKLKDLAERAESINGTHEVPVSEMLTPGFLARHTRFLSADELFEASGFKIETAEDFEKVPDEDWDEFIQQSTPFADWSDMLSAAGTEWTRKKLGLGDDNS